MHTVLGLAAFVVISVAAGITWVVVRVSPAKKPDAAPKS